MRGIQGRGEEEGGDSESRRELCLQHSMWMYMYRIFCRQEAALDL